MHQSTGVTRQDLQAHGRKVVRLGGKQVLLIAAEGAVHAIANRCPHEGYPLSEGTLGPGCVLTCDWHNWKFDLGSGAALMGRDPVRTYPVRLEGEVILVDLTDPPADAQRDRALAGLGAALADNDRTRMAREVARLERAGFDGRLGLAHALAVRGERLEGGMTHAHAAAADWLALSARAPNADLRLAALLEPLGHLAWDTLGAGRYPYPESVAAWDAAAFAAAMEREDEAAAQALVRGALADGLTYPDLRPALAEAALAHYADFGHSAIYVLKAGQLIEALGPEVAAPMLQALVRQLVYARREDRLPEFRSYAGALAKWGKGAAPATADAFAGCSVAQALKRTLASSGRSVPELYDALLGAAAWTLLHFDLAYDTAAGRVIADNVNWLDFTHALTFANAARHLCRDRPDLWPRALLQLALFIGRNRAYVSAGQDVSAWAVADPAAFVAEEMTKLYDHGVAEPIIACHRLKVLFALEDELAAAPDAPWAATLSAAVNRYLNTPPKRHHGLRLARQARAFIAKEG
ncbi:MAG TPA: Rieske (2Fe-2S) protein [Caulobacteraceae bacterium]|jgi:nitrite reductase/ring-hydroxylating ferredoxin subunit|nr:Rieske (2Fe-2S) protein [Caulobacteraceae bacterium]